MQSFARSASLNSCLRLIRASLDTVLRNAYRNRLIPLTIAILRSGYSRGLSQVTLMSASLLPVE
jgi:hypothetical protein